MRTEQKKIGWGYLVLVSLLIFSGAVSWKLFFKEYRQQDSVSIHLFPTKVESWVSTDLPLTEDDYAILETRNVFTRRYKHPSGKVAYLMLVYSESNRKVSHPPEICYAGSGVSILSNEPAFIELAGKPVKVNRLFVEQGNTQQVMYYWFKVGDTFTANYWKQQALIVWKTLIGKPASSALLRVAVSVDEAGTPKAIETMNEFTKVVSPFFQKYLPG